MINLAKSKRNLEKHDVSSRECFNRGINIYNLKIGEAKPSLALIAALPGLVLSMLTVVDLPAMP